MSEFETLKQEWADKYRTPVVSMLNPNEQYVACLVVPQEDDEIARIWNFLTPDEADARLLGQYIEYRLQRWYSKDFTDRLKAKPLDLDPGVNTVSFVKTEGGWRYSRASWRDGPPFVPVMNAEVQYATLLELIDHEQVIVKGQVFVPWLEYKLVHNII